MPLSTGSAVAASVLREHRLYTSPLSDPFEISIVREFRLRGVAWGLFLSAVCWCSLIAAGREVWSLWR